MLALATKWPKYNAAQVQEPANVRELLQELCAGLDEPMYVFGRPGLPLRDVLFSMVLKVYRDAPARKFVDELEQAQRNGLLSRVASYNSLLNYFESETITPCLRALVIESSKVLSGVETVFAVDSTGFSIRSLGPWRDTRFAKPKTADRRSWIKVHVMCGVLSNIVTAVEISKGNAGDSPFLKQLYKTTALHFRLREVLADKAYSSLENMRLVSKGEGIFFCPFKSNAKAEHRTKDPLWTILYHLFSLNTEWFYEHYHKRSNVESTFSMMKRNFGEYLWSRRYTAQVNEALCKVICHNLSVINNCIFQMELAPHFWSGKKLQAKVS
jgi:transposase